VPIIIYRPMVQFDPRTKRFSGHTHDIFMNVENHSMLLSNIILSGYGAGKAALKDLQTFSSELQKRSANSSTVILHTSFDQVKNMVFQKNALAHELAMNKS